MSGAQPGNRGNAFYQRVVLLVLAGFLGLMFTWLTTRASEKEVERLDDRVQSNTEQIGNVEKRITNVQINVEKIGVAIDRLDRAEGGPGVRLERREP